MNRMIIRLGVALVAAVVVAACGGGGGGGGGSFPSIGGTTATTPVTATDTDTDTDTLDAFLARVKSLVATALDTAEPADVTAFDPPTTTETREPMATQ